MPAQPCHRKTAPAQQHRYTTGCNYTVFRSQCQIAPLVLFVFPQQYNIPDDPDPCGGAPVWWSLSQEQPGLCPHQDPREGGLGDGGEVRHSDWEV